MTDLKDALLSTLNTLMFIPLIVFCFIPVAQKAKNSLRTLVIKIIFSVITIEIILFFIYYYLPYTIAHPLNTLLCVVIFFWLYQREVDVERSHLWFLFTTACFVGGFSYLVYHVSDILLNPLGTIYDDSSINVLILQIVFECLLIFVLRYPTKKYLGWLVLHFHGKKVWKFIWIFPTTFTTVFYFFIPYDNSKMYLGRALELYLIAIVAFLIIAIVIYIMFYQIAYNIVENQRISERALYLEMEAEQYRRLQEYVNNTSRLRHDFRYQLTALSTMIERKEYKEARKYLKEYSLEISNPAKQYCQSSAVNAVLNHYAACFYEAGISYHFGISIERLTSLKDTDFCVLLGNLLENALHACRLLEKEEREIELKIGQTSQHVIVLSIRNPYDGNIKKDQDIFLSTKHKGRGQGLRSVTMIAEKYNGFMNVEYSDNKFVVKVLLNV